jgi:hypothetical protein
MNFIIGFSLLLLAQAGAADKMDAAQFSKILATLHSPIRDVELISEGEYRAINETDPDREAKAAKTDMILQANYVYRSDGRVYLDAYEKLISDNSSMSHRTFSLVGSELETRIVAGSFQKQPAPTQKDFGASGSIDNKPGSPGRFLFLNFWREELANHPDLPGYVFDGWESLDGHECLKITLNQSPGGEQKSEFWIDMNRGGHVLRQDFYTANVLWYRKHKIELAQVKLPDGVSIWFPIRGVFDTFLNGKGPTTKPVIHEVDGVVEGSLVFNQGLPDDRFTVDWDGKKASTAGYSAMKERFAEIPTKNDQPIVRRDAASVRKSQEEKLAEVERKAEALDASPTSQRSWNGTTIWQSILTVVGIVALVFAFVFFRRPE